MYNLTNSIFSFQDCFSWRNLPSSQTVIMSAVAIAAAVAIPRIKTSVQNIFKVLG